MLEQLLKLVEQNAKQPIVENSSLPNQFNNAVIKEVTNQIYSSLKHQVSQGNMQQIVSLFQNTSSRSMGSSPVISTMISAITSSLNTKFGITTEVAQSIASSIVPTVIEQIIKKSKDPQDIDFDLQQMMRGMSGNNSLDISAMMGEIPKSTFGNIGHVFGKLFGK